VFVSVFVFCGWREELQQNPGKANRPDQIMRYKGALGRPNGLWHYHYNESWPMD